MAEFSSKWFIVRMFRQKLEEWTSIFEYYLWCILNFFKFSQHLTSGLKICSTFFNRTCDFKICPTLLIERRQKRATGLSMKIEEAAETEVAEWASVNADTNRAGMADGG